MTNPMAMATSIPSPPTSTFLQSPKLSLLFLTSFITLLLLYQINSTQPPSTLFSTSSSSLNPITLQFQSKLKDSVTFLPLKDLRLTHSPSSGNTWFMSSLEDDRAGTLDQPAHIYLPSPISKNRLLCLSAHNPSDGASNLYALAFPGALPRNATLLRGLTFVSDTLYDYSNLWHGLSALVPFVAWHESGGCARPDRWVLFHWGELRSGMGGWLAALAEATIGSRAHVETFEEYKGVGPVCFEKAVVCRRNDGGMATERKEEVYDMMRCKAREHCNITTTTRRSADDNIRLTLFFRVGARAFRNETAVAEIFGEECRKVEGCALRIARPNNLTFCDQVKLMTDTDILVTPHGAQLTNMIFMDKNSSVLEFFPKGWKELAGVGQYVFQWQAGTAGMRHQGQWRDQNGKECPYDNNADCFSFYKDGKVGHDKDYFAKWMASVLKEVKELKLSQASSFQNSTQAQDSPSPCPCN